MATTPKKTVTAVAAAINGSLLTLTFAHGRVLTVDAEALSPEIRAAAIMHGLKQKLIDGAAIARDPDTGRTATIDDKYDAVVDIYSRITDATAPAWNKARGGEGTGPAKGGLLVAAMMRLTSKPREEVLAYVDGLTKEQVAALRKNPRVAELIVAIQAERTKTTGIDSDSLLDGLMSGGGNDIPGDGDEEEDDETDGYEEALV